MSKDRGERSLSRSNYALLELNSSCTNPQPQKLHPWLSLGTRPVLGPCTKCPQDGRSTVRTRLSTSTGGAHSFLNIPKCCPSSISSEHQGCSIPRDAVGAALGGDGIAVHLCLEKVLLCWANTRSNSTFIASFQSDCAGECVQKQMDPLSASLPHIISCSLGAIKLPGRTNLRACAVPYFQPRSTSVLVLLIPSLVVIYGAGSWLAWARRFVVKFYKLQR